MSVLTIIAILFVVALLYVLFAPLRIEIDSRRHIWRVQMVPVLIFQWIPDGYLGRVEIRILGLRKSFPVENMVQRKNKKRNNRRAGNGRKNAARAWAAIRSFRVHEFVLDLDTGNMILNAYLYPVLSWFGWLSQSTCAINYCGRTALVVRLENTVYSIARSIIFSP